MNSKSKFYQLLNREDPGQFLYAPNYWQWFAHHHNHGTLPEEIAHCRSQEEMIKYLGLDIFSRNIYSIQNQYWFGGLSQEGNMGEAKKYAIEDTTCQQEYVYKKATSQIPLCYGCHKLHPGCPGWVQSSHLAAKASRSIKFTLQSRLTSSGK